MRESAQNKELDEGPVTATDPGIRDQAREEHHGVVGRGVTVGRRCREKDSHEGHVFVLGQVRRLVGGGEAAVLDPLERLRQPTLRPQGPGRASRRSAGHWGRKSPT